VRKDKSSRSHLILSRKLRNKGRFSKVSPLDPYIAPPGELHGKTSVIVFLISAFYLATPKTN
jgi:hypothetical protein